MYSPHLHGRWETAFIFGLFYTFPVQDFLGFSAVYYHKNLPMFRMMNLQIKVAEAYRLQMDK
jgi:hypothetical protein